MHTRQSLYLPSGAFGHFDAADYPHISIVQWFRIFSRVSQLSARDVHAALLQTGENCPAHVQHNCPPSPGTSVWHQSHDCFMFRSGYPTLYGFSTKNVEYAGSVGARVGLAMTRADCVDMKHTRLGLDCLYLGHVVICHDRMPQELSAGRVAVVGDSTCGHLFACLDLSLATTPMIYREIMCLTRRTEDDPSRVLYMWDLLKAWQWVSDTSIRRTQSLRMATVVAMTVLQNKLDGQIPGSLSNVLRAFQRLQAWHGELAKVAVHAETRALIADALLQCFSAICTEVERQALPHAAALETGIPDGLDSVRVSASAMCLSELSAEILDQQREGCMTLRELCSGGMPAVSSPRRRPVELVNSNGPIAVPNRGNDEDWGEDEPDDDL